MTKGKWIEYTGSDKQYSEIINSRNGFMLRDKFSKVASPIFRKLGFNMVLSGTEYLICDPHPYADEIKIWADTGCMIYVREPIDYAMTGDMYKEYVTDQPNWNIPNAIFRLTPFED